MLRTDERALLVDLLTPPAPGYRLEHAVGTTFTMQLESLLRVPLAVVGAEMHDGIDPLGVMEAVRSSADRIDVFCQAGMLSVPSAGNALLAFLEPIVHQVRRPRPGSLFHPKVWLASFSYPDEPRRFRLLCSSRNLTSDRAWDTVVGLDGIAEEVEDDVNTPLAEFIESLPSRVPNGVPENRAAAIAELAQGVRFATWELPSGAAEVDWLRFHWLDAGRDVVADFTGASRRLVISPFLNPAGLERVWPDGDCTIVSRPESFAELGADYVERARTTWGAHLFELDDAAAIPSEDDEDAGVRWSLRGLHAKVVVLERNRRAHVFIGSPNATGAAWSGNTEFAVEIIGSPKHFGVKAALAEQDGSLASILRPFSGGIDAEPTPPDLREQLEWALVDVASCSFHSEASPTGDLWQQRVRSGTAVSDLFPEGAQLSCRLLTGQHQHAVEPGTEINLTWSELAAHDVTPFVVLELSAGPPSNPVRASCIVMAELTGGPPDRIDRLIASQVGSAQAFLQFLMLLLQLGRGDDTAIAALLAGSGASQSAVFTIGGAGVLESLVVALADHPESIDEIDRLVNRLMATDHGRSVLPPDWGELWPQILDARNTLRGTE